MQLDGRTTTLMYGPDSNADITVFEGGGMKWHIENLPPQRRLRAGNGMLTRNETQISCVEATISMHRTLPTLPR